MRRLLCLLAIPLCLVALGCGDDDDDGPGPVDHTVVETAIEASILKQQKLTSVVSCPTDIERRQGVKFQCTATLRTGAEEPVSVTVTRDDGTVEFTGLEGYRDGKRTGSGN